APHRTAVFQRASRWGSERDICRHQQLELGLRRDGTGRWRQHTGDRRLRSRLVDVKFPAPGLCPGNVYRAIEFSIRRWRSNRLREFIHLPGAEWRMGLRRGTIGWGLGLDYPGVEDARIKRDTGK